MPGMTSIMAGMAFVKITMDNAELKRGVQEAQGQIKRLANTAQAFSNKMLSIGAIAVPPIIMATKAFAAFDDHMRLTAAVSGATGEQFAAMTEQAKKLGRETSFTAAQVAEGMTALGRMGFSPKQIQASIEPMMNLARATGTDLATAAQIAANNLSVFKMNAEQASDVADILTVTANSSAQTLTDLGEALKMAGPHAARAGVSLQDTAAMLGVLANMGIRGSLAGTALGKTFKRIADPAVIDFLRTCGIEVKDLATGDMRNLKDILVDMAKYMNTLNNMERVNFAETVFDARGSLGGGTLAVNIEQIDKMMKKLADCKGAAKQTADEMDKGLGGTLRRLASAAEGISIAIGEIMGKTFGPLLESASAFCNMITDLVKDSTILAEILGYIGAATGVAILVKAVTFLSAGIKSLYAPLAAVNRLVSGSAANAAEAVAAEKARQAATETRVAQQIAAEKLKTMNELAEVAKQKTAIAEKAAAELQATQAKKTANDIAIAESTRVIAAKQAETAAIIAEEQKIIAAEQGRRGKGAAQAVAMAQAKIQAAQNEAAATVAAETEKQAAIEKTNLELAAQISAQNGIAAAAAKSATAATAAATKAAADYNACARSARAAAAAENKLTMAKDIANKKDLARGALLAKTVTMQKFRIAYSQREATVIMATSMKSMVAAKMTAGGSVIKTAGYYMEAAGAKVAAAATMALNAALGFLAANPVTVALIALYGAFKLVEFFDNRAAEAAEKNARVQQRLAEQYKQEREALEKRIQTDNEGIKKLVEMEKQGKLTAKQQLEAQKIIDALKDHYADLGIEIDTLTGKLTGATAAFRKMNEQQRQQMIDALEREAEQNQKSADALRNSFNKQFGTWDKLTFWADNDLELLVHMGFAKESGKWDLSDFDGGVILERMQDALVFAQDNGMDQEAEKIQKIIDALKKRQSIEERLKKLRAGGKVTEESEEQQAAAAEQKSVAAKELADAEKELARIDEENAKKKMSQFEAEIAEIDKLKKRYMELVEMKKADLKAQLAAAQQQMKQNQGGKTKQQELTYKAAYEAAEEAQRQIDELDHRAAQASADFDAQRKKAEASEAARREKAEAKYTGFLANSQTKQAGSAAEKELDKRFDALNKDRSVAGQQAMAAFMKQLEGSLTAAQQAYQQQLDKARSADSEGGAEISEKERAGLDAQQRIITSTMAKIASYRDRIAGGIQEAQRQSQTISSFDARNIAGMFGKKSERDVNAERTAKATEDSEKHLRELLTKIDHGWAIG